MSNLNDLIWESKYRPNKVADIVLPKETKKMVQDFLKSGSIPNLLLSGKPGTGKSTLGKAIAHELDADLLFINASLEGNIDTLRTTITQFVTNVSFSNSKKVVILDEADYLTGATMSGLRGFLDEFSKNAIFIFTCNYEHKIIAPLISRLQVIRFEFSKEEKQPAGISMVKRCFHILDSEGITYDKKSVGGLVSKNFPDFRKTLVQLQRYSVSGVIDSGILMSSESDMDSLVEAVKTKNFTNARQWVANHQMDHQAFLKAFLDGIEDKLVPQTIPQLILNIGESQVNGCQSIDIGIEQTCFLIKTMGSVAFK